MASLYFRARPIDHTIRSTTTTPANTADDVDGGERTRKTRFWRRHFGYKRWYAQVAAPRLHMVHRAAVLRCDLSAVPLVLLLEREGVYSELCNNDPSPCAAQEERLNLAFVLATVSLKSPKLPHWASFLTILGNASPSLSQLLSRFVAWWDWHSRIARALISSFLA